MQDPGARAGGGDPYPLPESREQFEELLASPASEDRLRAAMASFRMQDPTLAEALAARLVKEGNNLVKATLVKAVGRFQDERHLELLAGYLSDPDDRVRANTIEALGCYRTPRVVPMVQPLLSDESSRVRGNVLLVLAQFDRKRAAEVVNQFAASPERWKRETALQVLGKAGGSFGAAGLARMFRVEPDEDLRRALAQRLNALAKQGEPAAREFLLEMAKDAAAGAPRTTAASPPVASHEIPEGDPRFPTSVSTPPADRPVAYPEDLASLDPRRRLEAVQLAPEEGGEVLDRLEALLAGEKDEFVLATLGKKLGRLGRERCLPLLLPLLTHGDARVRANTLEGLAGISAPEVLETARRLLGDDNPRVRAQAARLLAHRREDQGKALSILKAMLLEGDETGALSALHALESIDAGVILEILELALVHPRQKIKARVLLALRALGERNALAARLAQRYGEGELLDSEEHLQRLLARMNSKDEEVRWEALRRLALSRSEKAQSRIELATSDSSDRVRNLARTLVEDFGLAYKRQGVLHSIGLAAEHAVRSGKATVPGSEESLEELDRIAAGLERAGEPSPDAPDALGELLARRREALVALGERIYREFPGLEAEGLQDLLAQLRTLEPKANPIRAGDVPPGTVPLDPGPGEPYGRPTETRQALDQTMRELQGDEAAPSAPAPGPTPGGRRKTTTSMPAVAPAGGLGSMPVPKAVLALAVFMAAIGGVLWWAGRGLRSNLLGAVNPWQVPLESETWVAIGDAFAYGATDRAEVLCVAAPTGALKWRKPVPDLRAELVVAEGFDLLMVQKADRLVSWQGPKAKEQWTVELETKVLGPGVVTSRAWILPVGEGKGQNRVRAYSRGDGKELWEREIPTGTPACLTVVGDGLLLVAGATMFHLELASGNERWSYDFEEDFLAAGSLHVDSEDRVLAAGPTRLVRVSTSGVGEVGPTSFKSDPLARHPFPTGAGPAVLSRGALIRLSPTLEEAERLALPLEPRQVAGSGTEWYLSDGSNRVVRLVFEGSRPRLAGTAQVAGRVGSLVQAGSNLLAGTSGGLELVPAKGFE